MTEVARRPQSSRTLAFLWDVLRRHGVVDCVSAARRKLAFHRLNKAQPPGRLVLREGVSFQVVPEIAYAFRYFIDMDPSMWREMDAFLAQTRGRGRLLDIGAHYGIFSLAFASQGGAALAVEPSSGPLRILTQHASLNPELKIRPVQLALSDCAGTMRMHLEGDHMVAGNGEPGATAAEIPMTTVDDLVRTESFVPDAIKIDVEGHEVQVLAGARELLRQHGPLIFLEVHPEFIPAHGKSVDDLVQLMSDLG